MKRALLVVMIMLCGVSSKSYAQKENTEFVIDMIKSRENGLYNASLPIVFKDDFIGSVELLESRLEDNFIKRKPITPNITSEKMLELDKLVQEKLHVSFRNEFPYGHLSINYIQSYVNELFNMNINVFEYSPIFATTVSPKLLSYYDGSFSSDPNDLISKELIKQKYGEINELGFLVVKDESKISEEEMKVWEKMFTLDQEITVKSSKPLKSFSYEVSVPIPSTKVFKLSIADSVESNVLGEFRLKRLNGNRVRIEVPEVLFWTLDIYGIYKDGNVLKELKRTKNKVYSSEQMECFEKCSNEFSKILKDVESRGNYTNGEIVDIINNANNKMNKGKFKSLFESYDIEFSGPLDHLELRVYGILGEPKQYNFTKDFSSSMNSSDYLDNEFFLCKDTFSNRVGLIGIDGKWIVTPMFSSNAEMLNPYLINEFVAEEAFLDKINKVYLLDRNDKTIRFLSDMEVYSYHDYLDRYIVMENKASHRRGVMDMKTGEIVIPLKYNHVHFDKDKWRVTLGEVETYLSLEGEIL